MISSKIVLTVAGVLAAGLLLPACNGGSESSFTPTVGVSPGPTQGLAPSDVLKLAKVSSETSDPFLVSGMTMAPADVGDESSDPMPVG